MRPKHTRERTGRAPENPRVGLPGTTSLKGWADSDHVVVPTAIASRQPGTSSPSCGHRKITLARSLQRCRDEVKGAGPCHDWCWRRGRTHPDAHTRRSQKARDVAISLSRGGLGTSCAGTRQDPLWGGDRAPRVASCAHGYRLSMHLPGSIPNQRLQKLEGWPSIL
jgi:hypothetical protein